MIDGGAGAADAQARSPFRAAAIERLSSPEQLDKLMVIARPADWLALAGFAALAAVALIWAFVGTVPTRVSGSGILVGNGGDIFSPVAGGEGAVTALMIQAGDRVIAGQRIARIAQPALEDELATSQAIADEARAQLRSVEGQQSRYAGARGENNVAQRRLYEQQQAAAAARVRDLAEQLAAAESLLNRGVLTRAQVLPLRAQLSDARQQETQAGTGIVQLGASEISARNQDLRDRTSLQSQLAQAERRVHDLRLELERRQWVKSPVAGHVVEIKTPAGTRVVPGQPIAAIETGGRRLQLLLYLPPRDGKAVKPGMTVNVSPSTVRKEEYGTLLGRVISVSDFPATREAMQATLQNDTLVQQFSATGAPFVARVALVVDPGTPTGYRWAGGRGPSVPLSSGTLADAQITVKRSAPIGYVIPALRRERRSQ